MDPMIRYCDVPSVLGWQAGEDGTIWSCRRSGAHRDADTGEYHRGGSFLGNTWRQLKPARAVRTNHLIVHVAEGRSEFVHRLVLEAFVGPCPDGMECCHDDGNPENNHLSNLRWDTRQANSLDRIKHDRHMPGERNPSAKLNSKSVSCIRLEREGGVSIAILAREFSVSESAIRFVCERKTWRHVL